MVPKIKILFILSILLKPTRGNSSCLSLVLQALQNLADSHGASRSGEAFGVR
jgi:hypothetical protein